MADATRTIISAIRFMIALKPKQTACRHIEHMIAVGYSDATVLASRTCPRLDGMATMMRQDIDLIAAAPAGA